MTDKPTKPKRELSRAQKAHLERNKRPASGIPAKGHGWGGPAKGEGHVIADAKDAAVVQSHATPERMAEKSDAAEKLKARLIDMGLNTLKEFNEETGQEVKVEVPVALQQSAIIGALNRLEGTPVQRVITADGTAALRQWMIEAQAAAEKDK